MEDYRTLFILDAQALRHCNSQSVRNSAVECSQIVEMSDNESRSIFNKQNYELFKVNEHTAAYIRKMHEENQSLQTRIRYLEQERSQLQEQLKTYEKQNHKSRINMQPVGQTLNHSQSVNKNKEKQVEIKIGSLTLQLQRQKRQRETMIQGFNRHRQEMAQELTHLHNENIAYEERVAQLNQRLHNMEKTSKQHINEIQLLRSTLKTLQSKSTIEASIIQKLQPPITKSQFQSSINNLLSEKNFIDNQAMLNFIKNFTILLHNQASKLIEDNTKLTNEVKLMAREKEATKLKIRQAEDQNCLLKGKLSSYQSMIDRQQGDIGRLIKMQDSEVETLTSLQTQRLQKKYITYREQAQNLKQKLLESQRAVRETESKHLSTIIQLQKALVQKILPLDPPGPMVEVSKHLFNNLHAELQKNRQNYLNQKDKCEALQKNYQKLLAVPDKKREELIASFNNNNSCFYCSPRNNIKRSYSTVVDGHYINDFQGIAPMKTTISYNTEFSVMKGHPSSEQSLSSSMSPISPVTDVKKVKRSRTSIRNLEEQCSRKSKY